MNVPKVRVSIPGSNISNSSGENILPFKLTKDITPIKTPKKTPQKKSLIAKQPSLRYSKKFVQIDLKDALNQCKT